jgi:hypothetical protein
MRDVLYFDSMLTPKIITFVYWLALFFVCIGGLGMMFGGQFTFVKFLKGIAVILGGGLLVRIWCELLIVLFKIYENIKIIADKK